MIRNWSPLIAVLLCSGNGAAAEPEEAGEFSTYTGVLMGLGARAAVGATTGYYIHNPFAIMLVDVAYSPIGEQTLRPVDPPGVTGARLYDIGLAFHVPIPLRKRWSPYGIIGGSVLCSTYESVATGKDRQSAYFGFQTGGGVRYFVGEDWGIRSELKVIISHRTFTRLSFGIFYQFDR